MRAIEAKDRAALDRILADDFRLGVAGQDPADAVGRAQWLNNAIDKDWSRFRYENMVVDVHGDRALVTAKLYFRIAPLPLTFDSGVVDRWVKRDGRWQVHHRLLGESQLIVQLAFLGGLVVASLLAAVVLGIASWRSRRRRRKVSLERLRV